MDMSRTQWSLNDIATNVSSEIRRDYESTHSTQDIMAMMFIGLSEEAGEVAGFYKRLLRNNERDKAQLSEDSQMLEKELGDVLWYLAGIAYVMNIDLNEVWSINRIKLKERYGDSSR